MLTTTATHRAGIYCRISQDRGGAGLGVARQEADARALCDRLGWEVVEVFTDNDLSAYRGKRRPGYEAVLQALAEGRVDAVVAWHPDRLHRSPKELEGFIDAVNAADAEVATVTAGDLDLSSPAGRMTARIHGAVARHESEHKSERIRRKHIELAENGRVPGGGRRPFGYEKDRVTIRPDEADHIRAAAARILAGDSLRSVVSDWKKDGVRTVTGADWSPTTVKRLLMSGRISGQREHHGQLVAKAEWRGIIKPEQTRRLRAVLADASRNRAAGVVARTYLLSGFLYCGRCKARMTSRPSHNRGHRYERYVCSTDRGGCGRCGINAPQAEAEVVARLLHRLESKKTARSLVARRRRATKGPNPADELADLDTQRAELAKMWAAKELNAAEWKVAREGLDEEQTRLEAMIAEQVQVAAVAPEPAKLREQWDDPDLTLDRRRAILSALIERVEIAPIERGGNRFDPDRVSVEWRI